MIEPEEARRLIAGRTRALEAEEVETVRAIGRVLAEPVSSPEDLPAFDNSAMDGYAVRGADVAAASSERPARLALCGLQPAGPAAAFDVGAGQAARIFTGGPLPKGADCVVIQEDTRAGEGFVEVLRGSRPGNHVRSRASDVRAGQKLLEPGATLRPYEIALLASLGVGAVRVVRRPVVAVLATGAELLAPGREPAPGLIRNSNGPALVAALERWGLPTVDGGAVDDDPEAVRAAVERLLVRADVLLTTGGVSVGDLDVTRAALRSAGFEEVFWRVAIKPGKPLFFAGRGQKLAFGLPGNPVSTLVCLEEFVRPALEALEGRALRYPSYHLRGKSLNDYAASGDRRLQFLFCAAKENADGFELEIIRPQGSGLLARAGTANALALGPKGPIKRGDELRFRWLK